MTVRAGIVGVAALIVVAVLAAACGSSAPPVAHNTRRLSGEAALEDEDAPRFVIEGVTLPEPPASVDVDDPALEPVLHHARELLSRPLPVAESDMPPSEVGGYVEGRLAIWMNATAQGIRSLWDAMQNLGTGVLSAHVVARTITGATLVALAERLEALPLPLSVRNDPSISDAMRSALDNASRPMRDRAVQAFGACASTAVGSADPTLDEWRLHCDSETDRARGAH